MPPIGLGLVLVVMVVVRLMCARCRALSRTASPRGWWSPGAEVEVVKVVRSLMLLAAQGAMQASRALLARARLLVEEVVPARSPLAVRAVAAVATLVTQEWTAPSEEAAMVVLDPTPVAVAAAAAATAVAAVVVAKTAVAVVVAVARAACTSTARRRPSRSPSTPPAFRWSRSATPRPHRHQRPHRWPHRHRRPPRHRLAHSYRRGSSSRPSRP